MSFSRDLKLGAANIVAAVNEQRQAITLEFLSSIVADTPVDTGRARGNWQVSIGVPLENDIDRVDKSGAIVTAQIQQVVLSSPEQGSIWLVNNLPYIEKLEFGSSNQAPAGMVRKNLARIQQIISD